MMKKILIFLVAATVCFTSVRAQEDSTVDPEKKEAFYSESIDKYGLAASELKEIREGFLHKSRTLEGHIAEAEAKDKLWKSDVDLLEKRVAQLKNAYNALDSKTDGLKDEGANVLSNAGIPKEHMGNATKQIKASLAEVNTVSAQLDDDMKKIDKMGVRVQELRKKESLTAE